MKKIEEIKNQIVKTMETLAAVLLAGMVIINFLHIFVRFIWNIPFLFISELNGYLLIWIGTDLFARSFIRTGKNLLESDKISRNMKIRWKLSVLYQWLVLLGCVFLFVLSCWLVTINMNYTSLLFNIQAGIFYIILPVASLLTGFCSILSLMQLHRLKKWVLT